MKGAGVLRLALFLKLKAMVIHVKTKKRAESIMKIHKVDSCYITESGKVKLKKPVGENYEVYKAKKTTTKKVTNG